MWTAEDSEGSDVKTFDPLSYCVGDDVEAARFPVRVLNQTFAAAAGGEGLCFTSDQWAEPHTQQASVRPPAILPITHLPGTSSHRPYLLSLERPPRPPPSPHHGTNNVAAWKGRSL